LLIEKKINSSIEKIGLTNLNSGPYIVKVTHEGIVIKIEKIIKQ
jgi:hypothetical protein